MIFSVQYRLPTYYRWLLHDADHGRPIAITEYSCSTCSPGTRPGRWLLKSPAHLWQLDALVAEYPDALIVQTHRDPLNVISSISALTHHLRRLASDDSSIADCAGAVVRGDRRRSRARHELRDSPALAGKQIIDVQFADFIRDPFATIRALYAALGRELTPVAEQNMRALPGRPPRGWRRQPLYWARHRSGRRAGARAGARISAAVRGARRADQIDPPETQTLARAADIHRTAHHLAGQDRRAACLRRARPCGGRGRCRRPPRRRRSTRWHRRAAGGPDRRTSCRVRRRPSGRRSAPCVRSRSTEPMRRCSASRVGTVHSPWRLSEPSTPRSSTRSAAVVTIAPGPGRSPTRVSRSECSRACDTSAERSSNSSMSISPSATALCSRRNVPLRSASETRIAPRRGSVVDTRHGGSTVPPSAGQTARSRCEPAQAQAR